MKYIWMIAFAALFAACTTDTGSLGMDMMPDEDGIALTTANYPVTLESVAVDSVPAKTNACYLGSFTDPETGLNTTVDFLAQLKCPDDFDFPSNLEEKNIVSTELRLFYSSFTGDSLSASKVKVYPLTKLMDNNGSYTSGINPEDYYDATETPYATKTYTARDGTVDEDYRNNADSFSPHIKIVLPERAYGSDGVTQSYGQYVFRLWKAHPEYFKNSYVFNNNVCKGFYFKFSGGANTVLNVNHIRLTVNFKYAPDTSKPDSLVSGAATFAGTDEVIQTTHVYGRNAAQAFVEKANAEGSDAAYLTTPAGIFTAVTLPVDSLIESDSLNTARLALTYYKNASGSNYALNPSNYLLMVRKSKLDEFFKNNQLNDNLTSYVTSTSSSENTYSNTYVFPNIRNLMLALRDEAASEVETSTKSYMSRGMSRLEARKQAYEDYKKKYPDWNKVLLVPVTATTTTSTSSSGTTTTTITALRHNFGLTSAKLVKNGVQLQVIYSKIHN